MEKINESIFFTIVDISLRISEIDTKSSRNNLLLTLNQISEDFSSILFLNSVYSISNVLLARIRKHRINLARLIMNLNQDHVFNFTFVIEVVNNSRDICNQLLTEIYGVEQLEIDFVDEDNSSFKYDLN